MKVKSLNSVNNTYHRKDIQGLRAFAVGVVVAFHAGLPLPGGFTGVDIFFVISGFVITKMLLTEWRSKGCIDLKRFYFRRFKRIMPALCLMVSVVALISILMLSPLGNGVNVMSMTGIGAVLTFANAVIATKTGGYFDDAAEGNPLLNTWSLAVEEQFYFLYPLVLIATLGISTKFSKRELVPIVTIVLIGTVSIAAAGFGAHGTALPLPKLGLLLGFYSPITRGWEFAAGALVAFALKPSNQQRIFGYLLEIAGLALLLMGLFIIDGHTPWPGPLTLLPVIGTVLLILSGEFQLDRSVISMLLRSRCIVYLGDISYSWYLWHWPFIVFASLYFESNVTIMTLAALTSLLPAIASYRWVETPIRHFSNFGVKKVAIFAIFTLVPPISLCLIVNYANSNGYWSSTIARFKGSLDEVHAANDAGCGQGYVPIVGANTNCIWNSTAGGMPIYLIGDSNADHVSEAVISVGRKMGSPVLAFTKGGCAFLGRSWSDRSETEANKCVEYVEGSLTFLEHSRPGVVILGLSESVWHAPGASVGPTKSEETHVPILIRSYLLQDLMGKIVHLRRSGHQVLLLLPVPKFIDANNKVMFDPSRCTTISVLANECPGRIETTVEFQEKRQAVAREVILEVAQMTRSQTLDLRVPFCPSNICSNFDGERMLYRDAGHLTVRASAELSVLFASALKPMLNRSSLD